jgi:hypothetical protein
VNGQSPGETERNLIADTFSLSEMDPLKRRGSDDSHNIVDKTNTRMLFESTDAPNLSIKFQALVVFQIFKSTSWKLVRVARVDSSFFSTLSVVYHNRNKFKAFDHPTASIDKTFLDICTTETIVRKDVVSGFKKNIATYRDFGEA